MDYRRPPARGRAFTLVELLVVIGIIALLMSILLPTLGRVKEQANTIKCLSNLRSIMQGVALYSAENKGTLLPMAVTRNGKEQWWTHILAEGKYVPGAQLVQPTEITTRGPVMSGVFYCPNGNQDLLPPNFDGNTTQPGKRDDGIGSLCWRSISAESGYGVDVWYCINGGDNDTTGVPVKGSPGRRVKSNKAYLNTAQVRNQTQMVFLFDGVYFHHSVTNANRLNARHGNNKQTNLAFLDGHVETWQTADLPGGMNATVADFSLTNLANKYAGQGLKWWIDQP